MEVESKFRIPNFQVARQLRGLARLGEYSLGEERISIVRDVFYDTADRRLIKTMHALRVRHRSDGQIIVTLKGASERKGAIHRRTEMETVVRRLKRGRVSVSDLPHGDVSMKLRSLVGDLALGPFLTNYQTRHVRTVRRKRRAIGEWSLDRVQFRAQARRHIFYELEIELKKNGTEADLRALNRIVQAEWGLDPTTTSKFERALEFASAGET